jgi:hypothetical protein
MRRFTWVVLLALLTPCAARADALKRAGRNVHGKEEREEPRPARSSAAPSSSEKRPRDHRDHAQRERHHHDHPRRHDYSYDDDDDDDEGDGLAGYVFLQILLLPWTGPAMVMSQLDPEGYSVPIYPYADALAYSVPDDPLSSEAQKPFRARLRLGATARNQHLYSGQLAAQIDFVVPLALHVDYRLLTEAEGGTRSFAGLGNAELLFRFAESRGVRFHTGLGYLQWADPDGLGHGVGFVYGFEAYPIRPISFGSRLSIGVLAHTYAFQWRSHLGVMLDRYEIQLAYDHLDLGGAQLGGLQLSFEVHL